MAEKGVEQQFEVGRGTLHDRIEAYFDGFEPCTVVEVATELGISTTSAREALSALTEKGDLASKQVSDGVTVWYTDPGESEQHFGPRPASETIDRRVDAVVDGMDVPGTSGMMVSWRRDAVRAAVEFLRGTETATPEEIVEAVYRSHRAGYDDREAWWSMVSERLAAVPGVVDVEGRWLFDAAALVDD